MKKILSIVLFSALFLGLNGCKDYMDINYDPNSPSDENLTSDMILPAAEMNIATTYSSTLHIYGAYNVQYYAQQFGTPNYIPYSQFQVSETNGNAVYTQLFQRALGNLNIVKNKAEAAGQNGIVLQAITLRAFTFQLLVDAFGELPYKEAFNASIMAPHYDEGKAIYEGLIQEIDDALAAVKADDVVATSFIIPSKSLDEWISFANAVKLKLLTRMSNVMDVTEQIQKIIDDGKLPDKDIRIAGCWAPSKGQANPLFQEERSSWGRVTHNIIANVAIVASMQNGGEDPRLAAWFLPNKAGFIQGGVSGDNLSNVKNDDYKSASAWSELVLAYDDPVFFIAKTEVEFFLAEFYARKNDAANAAAHYAAAIEASFATAGVDGAAAHIAAFPYNQDNWKESIGVAKWKALAGISGFEGYTEARRLDYPAFGTVQGSDIYKTTGELDLSLYQPNKLYTPYERYDQVGDNHLLERFPYPVNSTARNSNAPAFPGYLVPIFWGK